MTIFYKLQNKLYINLTNRCSCACIFCIRKGGDGIGIDAVSLSPKPASLWLAHEPGFDEIKSAFDTVNLDNITEIIFCGYGEPMERADMVIKTCQYIKSCCNLPVRLNTNGLVRLINPEFNMTKLSVFNLVSISLNAADEDEYLRVTKPKFGKISFTEMLKFAEDAKSYTEVMFTVVDVINEEQIKRSRKIADDLKIPLRIRSYG
jgi:TatD family-associated radical SAM protein